MKVEPDEAMNHSTLRLLLMQVELLRKDYPLLIEGNGFQTARRCKKHLSNINRIVKEMRLTVEDRRKKIVDARWGGEIPRSAYTRKKKSETEPLVL